LMTWAVNVYGMARSCRCRTTASDEVASLIIRSFTDGGRKLPVANPLT
jgi:hypothetical protein